MQIILSTKNLKLTTAIKEIASENDLTVCCPENMLDMLFSDASILIIDTDSIRRDVWEAYLDYQQINAADDNTMLILLLPAACSVRVKTPCELMNKPQDRLYHCYTDDIEAIQSIINITNASPATV